jgi:peptidyl-dipeptidase Dcp
VRSSAGLLERYHRAFVRAGAQLQAGARRRLAAIAQRLAKLATKFNQNVLADEQAFLLVLAAEDLVGLPDALRAAAAETANARGLPGKYAISLARSSIEPFLQFSARRDLREKAFQAGSAAGPTAGRPTIAGSLPRSCPLRAERARLLGFDTAAAATLEFSMAKTPKAVRRLLMGRLAAGTCPRP